MIVVQKNRFEVRFCDLDTEISSKEFWLYNNTELEVFTLIDDTGNIEIWHLRQYI